MTETAQKPETDIELGLIEEVDEIDLTNVSRFDIVRGGLRFACRFQPHSNSRRLFVLLSAYVKRPDQAPPTFLAWGPRHVRAHVLHVFDPDLLMDERLSGGMFYGSREHSGSTELLRIVEPLAARLEVAGEDTVFFGGSGGGFAAGQAAIKLPGSTAVMIDPVLDGNEFRTAGYLVSRFNTVFGKDEDMDAVFHEHAARMSIVAARAARPEGPPARLIIAQNTLDRVFYPRQFLPFCQALGIPPTGGQDKTGTVEVSTFDLPDHHGVAPIEVIRALFAKVSPPEPEPEPAAPPTEVPPAAVERAES